MELDFLPIPLTWVLLAVLPVLFYLYAVRPLQFFKNLGVPGPTPLPFIGNLHQTMKQGFHNVEAQLDGVEMYGTVMGVFSGRTPMFIIADPEMMRDILVKRFNKFTNRAAEGMMLDIKPQNRMMTVIVDEDWKNVRSTISPAFSGGKLKQMAESMNSCANLLVENIGKFEGKEESFDTKELTGAFTMDVIARTGFGLEVDSQQNPQDPFVVYAKKAFQFSFKNPLIWLFILFPKLMKPILEKWNYNFMASEVNDFFYGVVDQVIGIKQSGDRVHRPMDFMQLMVDAHKSAEVDDDDDKEGVEETKVHGTKRPLTRDDIVANGFLFFLAGYETTATTMAFALYNLALNQEAQDKAREEINQVMEDRDLVDYEAVHKMTYLDMCINETLRMYPPAPSLARVTGEETKMKWLTIPKNMMVVIPVLAIHYDPKRYPEPKKFIPERFSKEEREKRDPYDWLPFGAGPRNCIGMRLALMELKVGLAKVLMKYRIVTAPDTDIPLKIQKFKQFPTPENGIRLRAEPL